MPAPVAGDAQNAVQTFLPLADFEATARALDSLRLGKQRVETLQVFRALTRADYGWRSHPVVLMWAGHEEALTTYGLTMCREWRRRGFADTVAATITAELRVAAGIEAARSQERLAAARELPPWLGDEALHLSHRSALVRKDPGHYAARFPGVPDDLPYVWPVRSEAVLRREAARRAKEGRK